jgi:hypothetical protein
LTAQYNRVLKQWDDNARKHAHDVLENKKTLLDGTNKWHKTEVSELKARLKCQKVESKDELKAELQVKHQRVSLLCRTGFYNTIKNSGKWDLILRATSTRFFKKIKILLAG